MAVITIGPTGDFQYANAAAYAALAGGATENTVNWQAGYTYTPDPASGKWWGRDGRDGMDKRIVNQIVGGGTNPFVFLTALTYVSALTPATYVGSDIWRYDLIDNSAAIAISRMDDVFFGARYSASAAGIELGWRQPPAFTLGDVGEAGLTEAGQNAGKGVWFSQKTGTVVELYVWCPGGSSARPEVQWGGIACEVQVGGAGQPYTTPKQGPFVFMRNASNDPSGSRVTGDFRMVGVGSASIIGIPTPDRASPTLVYGDIVYDGVRMYGGGRFDLAGSTAANGVGNTGYVHDIILRGDWSLDDRIDPNVFQCTNTSDLPTHGNDGRFENITVESRIRNAVIEGGVVTVGLSHGVFSLVPTNANSLFTGAGSEDARTSGVVVRNVAVRGRLASGGVPVGIRPFSVRAMYDTVICGLDIAGAGTPSKINGKNTLIWGNTQRLSQRADEGSTSSPSEGAALFTVTAMGNGAEDANLSVRLYANTFDRRGDTARGVNGPWAAVEIKAFGGDTIPADALDARGNTILADPAEPASCGIRIKLHGDGAVNRNQTWAGNRTAVVAEAREAPEGTSTAGTGMTAAALLGAGYTAGKVYGNVNDTLAGLLARADRPRRALSIAGTP